MKSIFTALLMLTLFLTACTANTSETNEAIPQEDTVVSEAQAAEQLPPTPTDAPAATFPPITETDTLEPTSEAATAEPAAQSEEEPPELTPLPVPTDEAVPLVISGQTADGAYFSGRSQCPAYSYRLF